MFLHQKYGHNYEHIENDDEIKLSGMIDSFRDTKPRFGGYDVEADGLNIIRNKPFLIALGYLGEDDKVNVWTFEPTEKSLNAFIKCLECCDYVFAHNAKFDYHMMTNLGINMEEIQTTLSDSITVMRLVTYSDDITAKFSLEKLGEKYIDENAKSGGKLIKQILTKLNRERTKKIKEELKHSPLGITRFREIVKSRVQFIDETKNELIEDLLEKYPEPNYLDAYHENKPLMLNYAADDVVIMLMLMKMAFPVMESLYGDDMRVFDRENKLIHQVANMERVGFAADVEYLQSCWRNVSEYRKTLYSELHELLGKELKVGQHKELMKIFRHKFGIELSSADKTKMKEVIKHRLTSEEAKESARLIIELRTIDKWLSTYIEGKMNQVDVNKIYSSVNTNGAVSGRVSSDMQQQPKKPLKDREGNELFHPRKVFINKEGYKMFYYDFSQMELRVQAEYTVVVDGVGDANLCSAFVPFGCKHMITGETFELGKKEHYEDLTFSMWFTEDGTPWTPIDLHGVTTQKAFPDVIVGSKEFKEKRTLGKIANFLKNYQGGVNALMDELDCDEETAKMLDRAYVQAFPKVKDYNDWLQNTLRLHGQVTNMYGRKYVFEYDQWHYKSGNYMIQGSCADMVKDIQIKLYEFLKPYKSEILYPIHDEIQFNIFHTEGHLLPEILKIMQDIETLKYIPMVSDVEVTDDNWANKREVHLNDDGTYV